MLVAGRACDRPSKEDGDATRVVEYRDPDPAGRSRDGRVAALAQDRLWFSNWGSDEILALDLDGHSEVVGRGGGGCGWAINWLPDGRMLVTGAELTRVEPDGSRVPHADLEPDLAVRLERDHR